MSAVVDSGLRTLAVLRFGTVAKPNEESWLSTNILSVEKFDELLGWLHREGRWKALTAEELVDGLEERAELPERALLITFDGGCRSLLDLGLRVLRKYRCPAMTFVPTDFVGRRVTLDGIDDPITVCTWEELRVLERNDVSIQSQGIGRRRFSRLDQVRQAREVSESREAIRVHVGRPASLFAYPQGDLGKEPEATERLVADAGYTAAFAMGGRVVSLPSADRFRLTRIPVGPETDVRAALGR